MKKIFFHILIFLLIVISTTSMASASFEFDNVVSFSKNITQSYGTITIKNAFGFPLPEWLWGGKIASYELRSVSDDIIEGRQHYHVIIGKSGTLFDDIFAYNVHGRKSDLLKKNILLKKVQQRTREVPIYDPALCDDRSKVTEDKLCANKKIGSKNVTESIEVWDEYKGEVLEPGEYDATVVIHRKPNHPYDIVPKARGFELKEFAWFDNAWGNKIPIAINFSNGTTVANYTVSINVTYLPSMQTTGGSTTAFGDLRIINESETGQLGYWFFNNTVANGTEVRVDFMLDMNVSPTRNYTAYLYYNNSAVNTTSNISSAGIFGDDFNTPIDWTNKWQSNNQGLYTVTSDSYGRLVATGTVTTTDNIQTQQIFDHNYTIEMRGNTSGGTFWGLYPLVPNLGFDSNTENVKDATTGFRLTLNGATVTAGTWVTSNFYIHKFTAGRPNQANQSIGWENGTIINSQANIPSTAPNRSGILKYTNNHGSVDWFRVIRSYPYTVNYSFGTQEALPLSGSITVALLSPANNVNLTSGNTVLNSTVTPSNANLTNATLYIWWSNGTLNTTTTALYQGQSSANTSNFTVTGLSDGNYVWNVRGCGNNTLTSGSSCAFASANFSFNLDGTIPVANLIAPVNNTHSSNYTHSFNGTSTDNLGLQNATLFVWNSTGIIINQTTRDISGTVNSTNISVTLPRDDNYTWNYLIADRYNNLAFNRTNYTLLIDSSFPLINLTGSTPQNNSNQTAPSINITITLTEPNLDNITYELYNNTATYTLVNRTTYTTQVRNINFTGLSQGVYFFNVTIIDLMGNRNSTETRRVIVDSTAPNVTIQSPLALFNYFVGGKTLFRLNWTISDALLNMSACYYDYNGANTSFNIVECRNGTVSINVTTYNPRNLVLYANDTNNNLGRNERFWNYTLFQNREYWNALTSEGAIEDFQINVTLNTGLQVSSANLIYNNTAYAGTFSNPGGTNYSLLRNLNIPNVDARVNNTIRWNITLSDGSNILTDQQNQTVQALSIDNCTTNTILILNYTLKEEAGRTMLTGAAANSTIEVDVDISPLGTTTPIIEFNKSYNQTNPSQVCINADILNTTYYRLDAVARYFANSYTTEFRYVQNFTLSNNTIPQNLDLLDLLSTSSQEFLITYRDVNFIPVVDALIDIKRKYIPDNQFLTVEVPKTDADGRTIGHFVLNDIVYLINVTKDGRALSTFSNIRVYCASVANDCRLSLDARSTLPTFSNRKNDRNISYSTSYNSTSRLYQFSFAAVDGASKTVNLTITRFDSDGNLTLCSQQISSTLGTLSCTLSSAYANSTGTAKVTVNSGLLYTDIFQIGEPSAGITAVRYILAAGLILILALLGFTSGPAMIMLFIVGLVGAGLLALLDWGGYIGPSSALIWIIIAALILLAKVAKEKKDG